jgi:RimJ/RimL family protein N-acetyltransferase
MIPENIFVGQQVRLTALTQDDLNTVALWYQDAGYLRLLDAAVAKPKSRGELQRWLTQAHEARDGFVFGIRRLEVDALIGYVELDGILWNQQTGFIALGIGERDNWDRGYGTEALQLAMRFAFDELNLHRVSLNVFSYNRRAMALYEKLGFRQEGLQREVVQRDGRRHDLVWYGLLRREWEERQPR